MVTCVGKQRLDRVKLNGQYTRLAIRRNDLMAIRRAVLHAMGMQNWREVEETKTISAKEPTIAFSSGD